MAENIIQTYTDIIGACSKMGVIVPKDLPRSVHRDRVGRPGPYVIVALTDRLSSRKLAGAHSE